MKIKIVNYLFVLTILLLRGPLTLANSSPIILDVCKGDFEMLTPQGKFSVIVGKVNGDKEIEGDRKTPEGIYLVQGIVGKSLLRPEHGPFAFKLNYPNAWDRIKSKTGTNIWVHGMISDDRIKLLADTKGCIALRNADLKSLFEVLSQKLVFVRILRDHQELPSSGPDRELLNGWRTAWESKDLAAFSKYYHENYRDKKMDRMSFLEKKERLFRTYKQIKVEVENPFFIDHPKYSIIGFKQRFVSDLFSGVVGKLLYLEGGKIISEEVLTQDANQF